MIFVYIIIGLFFAFIIYLMVRGPYRLRERNEYMLRQKAAFVPRMVDESKPLSKKVGKLVKKSTEDRYPRYRYYRYGISDPIGLPKDYYKRYYLTFETYDGYKGFTVTKETFHKYSTNTYGYIYYQKSRFSHFEVRKRDELGIDEHIKYSIKEVKYGDIE